MKLERLLAILFVLLEQKQISATRLAEMFEVSTRTIYRDIDSLTLAGFPIITNLGSKGGIALLDTYKVNKSFFSSKEITNLLIGLQSLETTLSQKEFMPVLAKVKNLIPANQYQEIENKMNEIVITFDTWSKNREEKTIFNQVRQAIGEHRFITFDYDDRNQKSSSRKIEPYQLTLKSSWYLQGFCTLRNDFRIFRLSRMTNIQISQEHFQPRPFTSYLLNHDSWIDPNRIDIELIAHKQCIEALLQYCEKDEITPIDKDYVRAQFRFAPDDYGYAFLMSLGSQCECIRPDFVRQELIQRLTDTLHIYKSSY